MPMVALLLRNHAVTAAMHECPTQHSIKGMGLWEEEGDLMDLMRGWAVRPDLDCMGPRVEGGLQICGNDMIMQHIFGRSRQRGVCLHWGEMEVAEG